MYYDTTGKSVSLLEGQYGKKNIDGKEFFLDSNGKEQFNLKKIAYNYSFAAIVLVIVLTIVSTVSKRRGNLLLLILYIWIIGYITLFFRETNSQQVNLKLFSTYKYILIDSNIRSGIFRNIWLFIPLGVILYNIYPKKIVLIIPFAFSALIETIQYFMSIGWFELDDILNNMIGGCIGYYTARLLRAFDLKLVSITSQNVIDETVDQRSEGRRTFERTGDQ
jgi:glycopeptide antibiotics resistance protein